MFIKNKCIIFLMISLILVTFRGWAKEIFEASIFTGYTDNVYFQDKNASGAFPVLMNSKIDYCYRYINHCIGGHAYGSYNKYVSGYRKNNILYELVPEYVYDNLNDIRMDFKYFYNKQGEARTSEDFKFRELLVQGYGIDLNFKTDASFDFSISGFKKNYKEQDPLLDYLDKDLWSVDGKIVFNYYPESSISARLRHEAVFYNQSPSTGLESEDFKIFAVGLVWSTLISRSVSFELSVLENYYKFVFSPGKFSTNVQLNILTRLSDRFLFNTIFAYMTEVHNVLDARTKLTKSIGFGLDFIIDPTIKGQTQVSYGLTNYSAPNVRNEVDFLYDFKVAKSLLKNIDISFNYKFDFVVSDDKGLTIYNKEEIKSYTVHTWLLGSQYRF